MSIEKSETIKQEFLEMGLNSNILGIRTKAEQGIGNYSFKDAVAVSEEEALKMKATCLITRNGKTLIDGVVDDKHVFYADDENSPIIQKLIEMRQTKVVPPGNLDMDGKTTSTYKRWYTNNTKKFYEWYFGKELKK